MKKRPSRNINVIPSACSQDSDDDSGATFLVCEVFKLSFYSLPNGPMMGNRGYKPIWEISFIWSVYGTVKDLLWQSLSIFVPYPNNNDLSHNLMFLPFCSCATCLHQFIDT